MYEIFCRFIIDILATCCLFSLRCDECYDDLDQGS